MKTINRKSPSIFSGMVCLVLFFSLQACHSTRQYIVCKKHSDTEKWSVQVRKSLDMYKANLSNGNYQKLWDDFVYFKDREMWEMSTPAGVQGFSAFCSSNATKLKARIDKLKGMPMIFNPDGDVCFIFLSPESIVRMIKREDGLWIEAKVDKTLEEFRQEEDQNSK